MHKFWLLFVLAGLPLPASTILSYIALGPSFDGLSIYNWNANVIAGLRAGGAPQGDPTTSPEAFQPLTGPIDPASLIYS